MKFLNPVLSRQREIDLQGAIEVEYIQKFGHIHEGTGNGIVAVDGFTIAPFTHLSASAPFRVRSGGNPIDHHTGSGMQSLFIDGIDDQGNRRLDTLYLSGAAQSNPLSWNALRLNNCYGTVGSYRGTNAGDVNIENTSGSLITVVHSLATEMENSFFTVPKGYVAYVYNIDIHVDDQKAADLFLWQTQDILNPYCARRIVKKFAGANGHVLSGRSLPLRFPELTDIEFTTIISTAEVALDYSIELIKLATDNTIHKII